MATKQEIYREHQEAYWNANRKQKGSILDAVCAITGANRKSAIRRFGTLRNKSAGVRRRGRPVKYGKAVEAALKDLWHLAHEICAERLHPMIGEYVSVLKRTNDWPHDDRATELLCGMSLGAMKARLGGLFKLHGRLARGTTKPSALKEIIPIRRGPWENPKPGTGEIDTVAHCGASVEGDFCYTVQYTDVAVAGWTVLAAQWNKGEKATVQSIEAIAGRLPWPLSGLDPDSGSEFINWHLKGWCDERGIALTRTRPYMKNDHARIEQKNYANVRQFVGYVRLDDPEAVLVLKELYAALEDYINFFIPSMRCVEKTKINSKYFRKHDAAKTPYQRALEHEDVAPETKAELREKYAKLNPRDLKNTIDRLASKLRKIAGRRLEKLR